MVYSIHVHVCIWKHFLSHREDFNIKHRQWESAITTDGGFVGSLRNMQMCTLPCPLVVSLQVYTCFISFPSLSFNCSSWVKLGLPLDPSLLSHASQYLCSLVAQFISLVLGEASRIHGLLVSMKCIRTTQVCECLSLQVCVNM